MASSDPQSTIENVVLRIGMERYLLPQAVAGQAAMIAGLLSGARRLKQLFDTQVTEELEVREESVFAVHIYPGSLIRERPVEEAAVPVPEDPAEDGSGHGD